jgi:tRNA (cmo5U34)-methyltransferase
MNAALNGFNPIAGFYDRLARFVFGKAIVNAQTHFLGELLQCQNVLVLGGGTGWIAEEILKVNPAINITYIDASDKMIQFAEKRLNALSQNISLIHGTQQSIPDDVFYDAVITNFFLDLFPEGELEIVVNQICNSVKPGTLWLVCDFENQEKIWQEMLLRVMYQFFRATTGVSAKKLPGWRSMLKSKYCVETHCRGFYHGFIQAVVFRLNG